MAIVPLPNGQMPATARNRGDLPEPDGPGTSTPSAGLTVNAATLTSGSPLGKFTSSCSSVIALPFDGATSMVGSRAGTLAAELTDISKPSRRAITERHSASDRYAVTKND